MALPPATSDEPGALLSRALATGRLHAAFLLSSASGAARDAALDFARGVVCRAERDRPCGACRDCRLSSERDTEGGPVAIDGTGKKGPLYRHVGDHPDLYWIDRGEDGTRVRISQVRALKNALRLTANEGGWRAVVIADAEWLNAEAQNALLKLLEEPPDRTAIVLVTTRPAGLLATIRSRCQRVAWNASSRVPLRGDESSEEEQQLAERLDRIAEHGMNELLDWAEEYRGPRAIAAQRVGALLATSSEWLRERVTTAFAPGDDTRPNVRPELAAFDILSRCRKDLAQRNANPQMIAERALIAVRQAVGGR